MVGRFVSFRQTLKRSGSEKTSPLEGAKPRRVAHLASFGGPVPCRSLEASAQGDTKYFNGESALLYDFYAVGPYPRLYKQR